MELLKAQGYKFKVIKPDVEEISSHHKMSPSSIAITNSRTKAVYLSQNQKNAIILSADTIVVLNGEILGKPCNKKQALNMLLKLNNKKHYVITAYSIIKTTKTKISLIEEKVVKAEVTFGNFKKQDYVKYINSDEPSDKAGAYAIQGLGARFIKDFKGSYTNIVGLPLF
ncbi:MAG: nucleoside triphosphate pyrophosphatase, partial [bacterium]